MNNQVTQSGAAAGMHYSFQDMQLEESKGPHAHPKES